MKKYLYLILLIISIAIFSNPIQAAGPVTIDSTLTRKNLGLHLEYIEDSQKTLTFEKIISGEIYNKYTWKKSAKEKLGFGFSENIYWVRFTLENITNKEIDFHLNQGYPPTDSVRLYYPDKNKTYSHLTLGDSYPFSERPVEYRSHIFPLRIMPNETMTCYMRFETQGSMNIDLAVMSVDFFQNLKLEEYIFYWMFFGMFLVMFIYNLFIFGATRDSSYFYYIFYIASFLIFVMSMTGMGNQYLWPNSVWLANFTVPLSMSLIIFSIIQFALNFINVKKYSLSWNKFLKIIAFTAIVLFVINVLLSNYHFAVNSTNILTLIAATSGIVSVAYLATFKKSRQAWFFLGSFSGFLIGVLLMVLHLRGVIPATMLTTNGILIGAVIQVITLSLGLADRINTMRRELKVLNHDLEQKVEERTEELRAANEEMEAINQVLTDARDALWGEMQLAKKIQTVLLPDKPAIPDYDISVYMEPAEEVGGDYYDIINTANKDWIIIGDVSGHGVPAGLVMMMVQTLINAFLLYNPDFMPSELLSVINHTVWDNIHKMEEDKYMTITVLAIQDSNRFYHSGLHQDILIYRAKTDTVDIVETDGIWVGIVDDIEHMLIDDYFTLEPGDTALLYTDGITEAWAKGSIKNERNPDADAFGTDRLVRIFQENGTRQPDTIRSAILTGLEDFDCDDDVSMVILKRTG